MLAADLLQGAADVEAVKEFPGIFVNSYSEHPSILHAETAAMIPLMQKEGCSLGYSSCFDLPVGSWTA